MRRACALAMLLDDQFHRPGGTALPVDGPVQRSGAGHADRLGRANRPWSGSPWRPAALRYTRAFSACQQRAGTGALGQYGQKSGQGVRFVVNPTFPLEQFLQDWTAPHELSHLLIPYLGRRHAWFAEGFASYMQYQVMYHMGVMDWPQVVDRYRRQMTKAAEQLRVCTRIPFPCRCAATARGRPISDPVLGRRSPVSSRWTAACVSAVDQTLGTVIAGYLACCRMRTRELAEPDRRAGRGLRHHGL